MRLWVYKVNTKGAGNIAYGDWRRDVFDKCQTTGKSVEWGGAWATGKPKDQQIFRDELKVGDYVLAWQTNKQAALGTCVVTAIKASGDECWLDVFEQFPTPIKLNELKKSNPALREVSAFKQGNVGTIYATTTGEARTILSACKSTIP